MGQNLKHYLYHSYNNFYQFYDLIIRLNQKRYQLVKVNIFYRYYDFDGYFKTHNLGIL